MGFNRIYTLKKGTLAMSADSIRREFSEKLGKSYCFQPAVCCDGLGAGNGELINELSFSKGSLVTVLSPGQVFRGTCKRARIAKTSILGNGPVGTLVFLGCPNSQPGVYYHFGVEIASIGVSMVEEQGTTQ